MKRELSYVGGEAEGPVKNYYESGLLWQQGQYRQGKEHGPWLFYDERGRLQFEGSYDNGEPTGEWYEYRKGKRVKMPIDSQKRNGNRQKQ
jgi:antitoxin component YwqK of YwqJK toxin-antitoxin module